MCDVHKMERAVHGPVCSAPVCGPFNICSKPVSEPFYLNGQV